MKLEHAKFLTKGFLQLSADLNAVVYDDRADSGEDDPGYLKLRRGVGEVLGVLYSEVMVQVFKNFPDSTPAMLRDDYEQRRRRLMPTSGVVIYACNTPASSVLSAAVGDVGAGHAGGECRP